MEIRTATKNDINTLIKFRILYLTDDTGELTKEQSIKIESHLIDYFNRHIDNDFTAYIAEDNGKAVSVIYLVRVERPANMHFINGKTAMLMNVYTISEYRRRGIASELLKKIIADAKEEGVTCIDLSATVMGKPLYIKNGFHERGSGSSEMRIEL